MLYYSYIFSPKRYIASQLDRTVQNIARCGCLQAYALSLEDSLLGLKESLVLARLEPKG